MRSGSGVQGLNPWDPDSELLLARYAQHLLGAVHCYGSLLVTLWTAERVLGFMPFSWENSSN